ncbi:DUF7503 family protein [Natronosalvus caseinilyticus]|nr:hypothetical protein [Natronosalvus caseinilyticus]
MTELSDYLKNHPRMIGVLFTAMLLLSQAGTVAAGNSGAYTGP